MPAVRGESLSLRWLSVLIEAHLIAMASQLQLASSRHMAAFLDHHLKTNNNSSSFGKDPHHHHLICKSPFSCSCHANATPPEESFISGGSAKRGGTKKIATPRCSDGTWTPGGKRPILEIWSDKAGRCMHAVRFPCLHACSSFQRSFLMSSRTLGDWSRGPLSHNLGLIGISLCLLILLPVIALVMHRENIDFSF